MKKLFLLLFSMAVVQITYAQEKPEEEKDQYFILIYSPGELWDSSKSPSEQQYFAEHSAHLRDLRNKERITIGGRYSDKGLIILKSKDETEAKEIAESDVSVQNKLFKVEIFLLNAFYKGCID